MTTTTVRISQSRLARHGDTYAQRFIGRGVVWTSEWSGERIHGHIEGFDGAGRPIIRFADGRWAFGDMHVLEVDTGYYTCTNPCHRF